MGMTLTAAISTARGILGDTDSQGYRYSDHDLLGYGNDAIGLISKLVPSLFYSVGDVGCVADSSIQSLSPDIAQAIVDVRRIKDGAPILPGDRAMLDAFDPGWRTMTPAAAVNWMPVADDPLRFELYPPAPAGQVVEVMCVRVPDRFAVDADTGLPTTLIDPIADYIVHRAESRDAEHVLTERMQAFGQSFINKVSAK